MDTLCLRRTAWIVFLGILPFLTATERVEAQCSKRIVVYLDISISMEPTEATATSPFHRTLTALERLVAEQGFLNESDALELVLFGKDLLEPREAEGSDAIRGLVRTMRSNDRSDKHTDLGKVISAITATDADAFNQQVFVIATDFVHDPENQNNANASLTAWATTLSRLGSPHLTDPNGTRSLVLFQAPVKAEYEPVQRRVIDDLRSMAPRLTVFQVEGATPVNQLVAGLQSATFRDLQIGMVPDEAQGALRTTLINDNCRPMTIERLIVRCDRDGAPAFAIENARGIVVGAISDESREVSFLAPLDRVSCPGTAEGTYRVDVKTQEKAESFGRSFEARNQLEIEGARAITEKTTLGNTLWLYLEMKGAVLQREAYEIRVTAGGATVAGGSFLPPLELPSLTQDASLYLMTLRTSAETEGTALDVVVRDGDEPIADSRSGNTTASKPEELMSWIQLFMILTSALVVLIATARDPSLRQAANMASLASLAYTAVTSVFGLALIRWLSSSGWLDQSPKPIELLDLLQLGVASMACFIILNIGLRIIQRSKLLSRNLASRAQSGVGLQKLRDLIDKNPEDYMTSFRRDAYAGERAAFWAMILTAVFIMTWVSAGLFTQDPRQDDERQAESIIVTDQL